MKTFSSEGSISNKSEFKFQVYSLLHSAPYLQALEDKGSGLLSYLIFPSLSPSLSGQHWKCRIKFAELPSLASPTIWTRPDLRTSLKGRESQCCRQCCPGQPEPCPAGEQRRLTLGLLASVQCSSHSAEISCVLSELSLAAVFPYRPESLSSCLLNSAHPQRHPPYSVP